MERTFIFTNVGDTVEAALQGTGEKALHSKRSDEAEKEKFLLEQNKITLQGHFQLPDF